MAIQFVRDEADKRLTSPLHVDPVAGKVRRWVRTKGYDQEGHMARMREAGYVTVARTPQTAQAGKDPRLTTAQGTPVDSTITRGDLLLMECPEERVRARQEAVRALTERRTQAVTARMQAEIQQTERSRR